MTPPLAWIRTLFAHQFLTMPDYVFRAYPEAVSAKFEWIGGLNPFILVPGPAFTALVTYVIPWFLAKFTTGLYSGTLNAELLKAKGYL